MNEQLKTAAKEFCEAEHGSRYDFLISSKAGTIHLGDLLTDFTQSLIDKGVLVEAENVMHVAMKKVDEEFIPALNEIKALSSAGKEVKTLQDFKEELAIEQEYEDFEDFIYKTCDSEDGIKDLDEFITEAAKRYCDQFKLSPTRMVKVVSDSDIFDQANVYTSKMNLPSASSEGIENIKTDFFKGAEWMREKLTAKP